MLNSWPGLKLKDIGDIFKAKLPDYILAFVRSYINYTCSNIESESLDNILKNIEYIFGLGAYQTDAITITNDEIHNYIINGNDSLGREIFKKKTTEICSADAYVIYMYYVEQVLNKTYCISFPLNKKLFGVKVLDVHPNHDNRQQHYKALKGEISYIIT
ncbi:MAG: hypothetical protein HUJ68_08555 [Clostridia bacterium]|nr:hypothetical protein [Clostridia bacterium]